MFSCLAFITYTYYCFVASCQRRYRWNLLDYLINKLTNVVYDFSKLPTTWKNIELLTCCSHREFYTFWIRDCRCSLGGKSVSHCFSLSVDRRICEVCYVLCSILLLKRNNCSFTQIYYKSMHFNNRNFNRVKLSWRCYAVHQSGRIFL